jgi:hypothetical protein
MILRLNGISIKCFCLKNALQACVTVLSDLSPPPYITLIKRHKKQVECTKPGLAQTRTHVGSKGQHMDWVCRKPERNGRTP